MNIDQDILLLFEYLHDSRPMLGAGSSSGLNSSRSPLVHGCDRMGQTSMCSSPHSHVVCPSSLNPHFCIRDLHRPVPIRRRFRLDQVSKVSLEAGGSDSLGLNESLCGVVWRWLDQRVSLRVRALPSRVRQSGGSCVLMLASFWLDLADIVDAEGHFLVSFSQAGMRCPSDMRWGNFAP